MTSEQISLNSHPVIGFGDQLASAPIPTPHGSPWPMLLASSVVSAAAGWAIEEVAQAVKKRKRR